MSLYKPSPLSFGSPRASPFRRPESPASPLTALRPTTPTTSPTKNFSSPTKPHTPITSPTKLSNANVSPLSNASNRSTPRNHTPRREPDPSPTRTPIHHGTAPTANATSYMTGNATFRQAPLSNDPLSKLPTGQVREMREAFEILDRDNDGQVTREDVANMLSNLGMPSSPSSLQPFFPSNTSPQLPLATFLSTLSSLLTPLSPSSELLSAFAAFDDDDSGQIDVHELRDALLHTSPMEFGGGGDGSHHRAPLSVDDVETVLAGFSGRRAFGGGKGLTAPAKGRGDVFRYREFVGSVTGSGEGAKGRVIAGGA
ncbi:hypothetical protein MMC07_002404 [Pseudocyphellaria aurata]|nr:hypothetical protein [Pseudocyphellaria aurata]